MRAKLTEFIDFFLCLLIGIALGSIVSEIIIQLLIN
jgi:hypothetical protein